MEKILTLSPFSLSLSLFFRSLPVVFSTLNRFRIQTKHISILKKNPRNPRIVLEETLWPDLKHVSTMVHDVSMKAAPHLPRMILQGAQGVQPAQVQTFYL
jgi:hypothetical protein